MPGEAHRARRRFGQHFLEPAWVKKLIEAIAPSPDETFIEIGPGLGALTRPLASRAGQVVAFEIDRDLSASLKAQAFPNLTVIEGDFLDVTPDSFRLTLSADGRARSIRVAGNLPYNVASPILFKLIALFLAGIPLSDAHLMLQREVADRLVAVPNSADYGVLAVLVGQIAHVRRVLALPPGAFRPMPKVNSAVVRLQFHQPRPAVRDQEGFVRLVRAVFTRRRKTLTNALSAFASQREKPDLAGIDGTRRPETLTIEEFARLADALAGPRFPARS